MYIFLIIIHVTVCLILIAVILLQAGRGGGLTEMAGGESAQSVLGTQAPMILKKATTISAIGFLVTSLLLGMVTARSGTSLFDSSRMPVMPPAAAPSAAESFPESAPSAQMPVQTAPSQAAPSEAAQSQDAPGSQAAPAESEESLPVEE